MILEGMNGSERGRCIRVFEEERDGNERKGVRGRDDAREEEKEKKKASPDC